MRNIVLCAFMFMFSNCSHAMFPKGKEEQILQLLLIESCLKLMMEKKPKNKYELPTKFIKIENGFISDNTHQSLIEFILDNEEKRKK
jgi:hypothetical protein